MGRIFVTGDLHGELGILCDFIERFDLGEEDTIICLGDVGLFWRKDKKDADAFIKMYEENFKTQIAFIDGNHDNFDILKTLENGCIVSDHITYLQRGVTFELNGKTFLAIGGADSVDRMFRTKHLSWWEDEQITEEDIKGAISGVKNRFNGHVDYVLSHACPREIFEYNRVHLITLPDLDQTNIDHTSEDRLQELKENISFDHWLFGHYHTDAVMDDTRFECLFHDFKELTVKDGE